MAPRAGALYDRLGPRLLVGTGATLVAASLVWCGAVLDKLSYAWLVPGYILMGVGVGLVMGPANTDAMNSASSALRGQASGVVQTVRQVGGTIGLAIMGTIVVNIQHTKLEDFLSGLGESPALVSKIENMLSQDPAQQQSAANPSRRPNAARSSRACKTPSSPGSPGRTTSGAIVMAVAAVGAFAVLRHEQFEDAEGVHAAPAGSSAAERLQREIARGEETASEKVGYGWIVSRRTSTAPRHGSRASAAEPLARLGPDGDAADDTRSVGSAKSFRNPVRRGRS